ncbi:MAG TPA: archaellin/type IV pilin N-terminal domain-containing protein [Dehalococcoidales bacterium]|nr:archaellin/type IV pilin N-terminal domain-containing protein [Dehalococcoidales bacterium]
MLRKIFKQKRYFKNIYKNQKGITGLETAIILIAFVVVAAVFAYTVLSAGLFSTQKSQEAVYNSLAETQATLEIKGAVLYVADSKFSDKGDDLATFVGAGANATNTLETVIVREGMGSIKAVATGAAANGDVMTVSAQGGMVVAAGDTVTFWAKTDGILNASFALHTTSALNLGVDRVALNAATSDWRLYSLTVTVPGTMFYGVVATGACANETYYIDDIEANNVSLWTSTATWTPYASKIILTMSLATGGQAVDFTGMTDSDANGLFNEPNKTNKIVVNYNDAYTHLADVAWSGAFIGNNNGDEMLDPGEKIKMTISLTAVNATTYIVDSNHQFTLEVKSPVGAILSLQRTMPARLYAIGNLN